MADISVFVGSVFGGALSVARAIEKHLANQGHQIRVIEDPGIEDLTADESAILVCTSTTGQGELPANILPFYLRIREKLPIQQNRPFGVIVLGDSSYGDTFCGAGELMEEAFLELACRKVGETLCIDACETSEPTQEALPWSERWVRALETD